MPNLILITGTVFINSVGKRDVREIVEPTEDAGAKSLAEIAIAGDKVVEWLDGPYEDEVPEDMLMELLGEKVAPRLPGV